MAGVLVRAAEKQAAAAAPVLRVQDGYGDRMPAVLRSQALLPELRGEDHAMKWTPDGQVMENWSEFCMKRAGKQREHYLVDLFVVCVRTTRHWRGRKFVFTGTRPRWHFKRAG